MTAEVAALEATAAAAGPACAVIVALGSRTSSLLNDALGTNLPNDVRMTALSSDAVDGRFVLCVGELDSRIRQSAIAANAALSAALQVAGVIVLSIRLSDVGRPTTSGMNTLFDVLSNLSNDMPRLLVVVVRDFDVLECTEMELNDVLKDQAHNAYNMAMKNGSSGGGTVEDVVDIEVVCVPSENATGSGSGKYRSRVTDLGDLLARKKLNKYTDNTMTAPLLAAKLANKREIEISKSANVPTSERELDATYRCDARLTMVLDKWRASTSAWKNTIDNGRIVASYGKEVSSAIDKIIKVFENDCAPYADTRAMARKRSELKNRLLDQAYVLYARQIGKCRELAYQLFRAKLGRVRINDKVERAVHGVVSDAENYFVSKAQTLVVPGAGWRFDSTRQELVKSCRDDATERLQLARLQGNYVKPVRIPLLFAFHTLLAAPFGKDSRVGGHPQAEEMQTKFDPDKVKKAELLRNRPYPTRHVIRLGPGQAMPYGSLDIFDELFGEADEDNKK